MTTLWESSIAITKLGRGFKDFSLSPLFGEDSHFDLHIFFNSGLVQLVKVKDRLGTCFVIPKRGFYMSPIFFNISPESLQKMLVGRLYIFLFLLKWSLFNWHSFILTGSSFNIMWFCASMWNYTPSSSLKHCWMVQKSPFPTTVWMVRIKPCI